MLTSFVSQAQMSVKSFKLLPNDNTALEEVNKRIDQNGQTAALIKIITSERGFAFEGGALGIVDANQQNDQVWLWIPRGARKVVIKHPIYGVLRDYRYPVEIQEGRTYEMVLEIEKSQVEETKELTKQFLSFKVTPTNAVLEVEDEIWTLDENGMAEKVVDFGTYHYWVHAENYKTDAGIIKVNNPDKATVVNVELTSTMGFVALKETPSSNGAEVLIDHVSVGKVPCVSKGLSQGNHQVELRKKGYKSVKQTVKINEGETTELSLDLPLDEMVTFKVNGVSFVMKLIPEGSFMMGGTDRYAKSREKPTHEVFVNGFFMGETEVTQELWKAVMGTNPSHFVGNTLPVEKVSWEDCQDFINKLNKLTGCEFRLPTEAEWEYAARGGTSTSLYSGEDIIIKGQSNAPNLDKLGWYGGNCGQDFTKSMGCDVAKGHDLTKWDGKQYPDSRGGSHPVKKKQPNAYGLYDMLGNVLEWCSDWYGEYNGRKQWNPKGPATGTERVLRGGSWYRDAEDVRISHRGKFPPNGVSSEMGFRLVMSVETEDKLTLAEKAMNAGNYEEAIVFYQQVNLKGNDEELNSKIALANSLIKEFAAADDAIKGGRFEVAETHLGTILTLDPTNAFVKERRDAIKAIHAKKRQMKVGKVTSGFNGSYSRHSEMGGIHFEFGAAFSSIAPYTETLRPSYRGRLYYAFYKSFPVTVDVNINAFGDCWSMGGGIGSAYFFTDKFTFNYGLGWQHNRYVQDKILYGKSNNFYYSLGLTYMFENQSFGGVSYSYNHSLGAKEHPVSSHNITYIFGKDMSIYLGALVGVLGTAYVIATTKQ